MNANLKLALRVLQRRKVFTAISLIGITLTLVVLIVAAAVLDNVMSAAEPQTRLDRMLFVYSVKQVGPNSTSSSDAGHGFANRVARNLDGAERVSLFTQAQQGAVYFGGSRIGAEWRRADAEYWNIHDFTFVEGSPYSESDHAAGRPVAVVTESLRNRIFGDSKALGRDINLAGKHYRVAGVVRDVPLARLSAYANVWTPLGPPTADQRDDALGDLNIVVLAKSRGDIRRLQKQFAERVAAYPIDEPEMFTKTVSGLDTNFEAVARTITDGAFEERGGLIVAGLLTIVALLFMTLPALNLITLNLSRALERSSEIGVRRAFGAPRHQLVRQFVMENVVLTIIGGVLSFVLAAIVLYAIEASGLFPDASFSVNVRVFAWGMILATVFGVISGAWPAWQMSRLNPVEALRGGAH